MREEEPTMAEGAEARREEVEVVDKRLRDPAAVNAAPPATQPAVPVRHRPTDSAA
jgi:hypothetical protein